MCKTILVIGFCLINTVVFSQSSILPPKQVSPGFLSDAQWISPASLIDSTNGPCPVFRRQFKISKSIQKATLYITAHGVYEARINGGRIGKDYFTPGYTSYDKRLLYQTYDVTSLLQSNPMANEFIATVGDGWYRGVYGNAARKNNYGKDASLLCKLVIDYKDGTQDRIVSDSNWKSTTGPIRRSSIYFGELVDANFTPRDWETVKVNKTSQVNLEPYNIEPVTQQERFNPQRIFKDPKGEVLIDFGQNLAGWVQIKVKGHKGDTIRITHAETLDKEGNLFLVNMLKADPTDIYILNGDGIETLEPHFTYHGFRYARVEGFKPTKTNCTAIALHSNLHHSGSFECSNPFINQLQHNIEWSLNSNLFEIPTDCPQRGERLGWTGDAQVIFRTAAFNRDLHLFFDKWLQDLALDQSVTGAIPKVIPDTYQPASKGIKRGVAGWGDAATIVPMDFFEIYGDTALLQRQYPSMKAWARYELSRVDPSDRLWKDWGYGDWLATGPQTDTVFLDQIYMIHSIDLVLQAGRILHLNDVETPFFEEALRQSKEAFFRAFLTPDGLFNNNTQTAYVLALHFNILPDSLRGGAVTQLVKLVHQNNDHLSTGFLGTPYLLESLSANGYSTLAYTLLEQETVPSWLYSVKQGATTIWERWDAIKPDGNFDIYSLNHYAYGAVGDWLYRDVAGIQPLEPGYKKFRIAPRPGGGLKWAKASYECMYGKIVSDWTLNQGKFELKVSIPANTQAVICLPDGKTVEVGPGEYKYGNW